MPPIKTTAQVQCRNCQSSNQPGSPYCSRCGAPIDQTAAQMPVTAPVTSSVDHVVRFSADGQDRALVKQTYDRAVAILTQGETIDYIATGRGGLGHAPDCAVATDKRVMLFRKKVLGKVELDDLWWRDVGAAFLVETKQGITLKLDAIQGWHLMIESLPKSQAGHIYDLAFRYADRLQGMKPVTTYETAETAPVAAPAPVQPAPAPAPLTPLIALQPTHLPNLGAAPIIPSAVPMQAAHNPVQSVEVPAMQAPAAAPAPAFIPTPESVLQNILLNSTLDTIDDGVPTRPMQWSAAAFQAPAVADVQPIVLTNNTTDTEPHMRIRPALTTLEKIAVFTPPSGPLSVENAPRQSAPLPTLRESGSLSSTPLPSTPLPSSPLLDPASLLGSLSSTGELATQEQNEYTTGYKQSSGSLGLGMLSNDELNWSVEVNDIPRVALPTGPIPTGPMSGPLKSLAVSGSLAEASPVVETAAAWTEPTPEQAPEPVPAPEAPAPVQQAAPVAQAAEATEIPDAPMYDPSYNNSPPTAPMGAEDYLLPMPGSTASGPLLAAAGEMDQDLEELYRNTSAMATQRLDYDAPVDMGDQPTRINLALHNTPPHQATPTRNSGNLNKDQHNTDELKGNRSTSSRTGSSRTKADDPIAKMKQLKTLLDAGLITEEDYASKKADILARI